ncbi:hypothetical protein PASE110613_01430 [Paenibacillus sediminis]|uniref:DUF4825 domain-containing protein n=1 Tax=Paenibacillus sediminis TaxID=664909 RepID=A0ABS4H0W0_9BACL|nr:hypothetical protein [Paenibacillus sediminis]MBP1935755.1 hypothetical protein [Paenibacillus sediminis]
MRRWGLFAAACIITFGLVGIMTLVSALHTRTTIARSEYAVFSAQKPINLTETNLVDYLSELPLTLHIRSVDWQSSILAVDLEVTNPEVVPKEIYNNMYEIIHFSIDKSANVNRLMIRFVAKDNWTGAKHLLLAADVRRGDFSSDALDELRSIKSSSLSENITRTFHVSETKLWQSRFGQGDS